MACTRVAVPRPSRRSSERKRTCARRPSGVMESSGFEDCATSAPARANAESKVRATVGKGGSPQQVKNCKPCNRLAGAGLVTGFGTKPRRQGIKPGSPRFHSKKLSYLPPHSLRKDLC